MNSGVPLKCLKKLFEPQNVAQHQNLIMASIKVNGVSYQGRTISINNGKVIIDGKDGSVDEKVITISVDGNVESLIVDQCQTIRVTGHVGV